MILRGVIFHLTQLNGYLARPIIHHALPGAALIPAWTWFDFTHYLLAVLFDQPFDFGYVIRSSSIAAADNARALAFGTGGQHNPSPPSNAASGRTYLSTLTTWTHHHDNPLLAASASVTGA
jgi:hypothetical protein